LWWCFGGSDVAKVVTISVAGAHDHHHHHHDDGGGGTVVAMWHLFMVE